MHVHHRDSVDLFDGVRDLIGLQIRSLIYDIWFPKNGDEQISEYQTFEASFSASVFELSTLVLGGTEADETKDTSE